jgi:hypothetical protein
MRVHLVVALLLFPTFPLRADIVADGGGTSSSSGATTALDNLVAVAVNTSLLPATSGTLSLGSATKPWSGASFAGVGALTWIRAGDPASEPRIVADANQTGEPIAIAPVHHVIIAQPADINSGYNFAVGTQTNPLLAIASANQSTNERVGIRHNQTQGQILDLAATATSQRPLSLHGGGTVASAATITPTGNVFHISGTTQINTITVMGSGTMITMVFDAACPVGDSVGNVNIGAAFTATAGDTLVLVSDGTSWYEVARSVN